MESSHDSPVKVSKDNRKMKKFRPTLKGVLDGLRSSVSTPPKTEMDVEETLRSGHFQLCRTVRHGFPYQPTSVAYDPVQHLLAIGTKNGSLRIFGRPGVDIHCHHEADIAVIQILFLVNEGGLVTVCSDDTLHLWNFRQKHPEIVHTLKFQRERITYCHLPFQSKWLYIGTERGNVHVVNIESFTLSGYVINWNKAIELSRKTHPGPVVHLSDNPVDPNKLLIGFESGQIVHWDLKSKTAECRYSAPEALKSISWHHEGKQFMCSHSDGSLTTWNTKAPLKPLTTMSPHAKLGKDGKQEPCKPIIKVEWKSVRNGEPLVIFSGGVAYEKSGRIPSITVMNGKSTTVLEMEHTVVDFVVLCDTPWQHDFQEPYAIVVLLLNDLVVVDLTSTGYPCFENPYPMDIHESPVTSCQYYADCPTNLIPAFYSVGSKQKRSGFSEKNWPVKGGVWGTATCSYPEMIITGHADGSIKFWDASAVTLQVLYKLKTAKIFEKPKNRSIDGQDEDPFAIYLLYLCPESRQLCAAGATHIMLFKFSRGEVALDIPFLEISIDYEVYDELDSPEFEYPKPSLVNQQSGSMGSYSSNASDCAKFDATASVTSLKVKTGSRKWGLGYQPELVCLLKWLDSEHPGNITSMSVNSSYGLLAFGNESGLAIVDYVQKTCLLNLGTPDLYGSLDPYPRAPRSPRGKKPPQDNANQVIHSEDGTRSPTSDQDKNDGSSFSRSRSSSMSSLENVSREAIQCLVFADSYTRKTDAYTCPCLWVGTSLGSVLVISLNALPTGEQRLTEPVIVSPSGTIFRLKGAIKTMSFLDCNGLLIPTQSEQWKAETKEDKKDKQSSRQAPAVPPRPKISPTSSTEICDRQYTVICSEKQARVVSLPSQNCPYKLRVTDASFVVKADIVTIRDSVCLGCYVANGHVLIFSLPSFKPLLDVDFLPLTDLRIARTFTFSKNGHALYLCSPTEVQKIAYSSEICDNLSEMLGDLFLPCEAPEAPKQGFFKNLFGGGVSTLDREELFGEASGKGQRGLATKLPGPGGLQQLTAQSGGATSEISRAKMLAIERGEKLGDLDDKTAQMMAQAESFAHASHAMMQKYKDKKWYQF